MLRGMTLDPETKARIEAEEAYRAQVRAGLKGRKPLIPPPAPPREGKQMNPLLLLVLILAAIWALANIGQFVSGLSVPSATYSAPPVGMEVQAQDTPDNYGIDLYLTLKSADGRETKAAGNAQVEIYEEPYDKPERLLWSKRYTVSASDFSRGTQGLGAFQRDAMFAHLGSVTTAELGMKSGDRVSVRAWFVEPETENRLAAKENAYLP